MALDPITAQSFAIIDRELEERRIHLRPNLHPLVRRAIHSTADFELAEVLRFHPQAVEAGIAALRNGASIVADVHMVAAGIDRRRAEALGGRIVCAINQAGVRETAQARGQTRSATGIRVALSQAERQPVVVVGNAPTALREVLRLLDVQQINPALIIGVPVGFVDAAESKEALMKRTETPWISICGRKGGSPVAAALLNALLHLALPDQE